MQFNSKEVAAQSASNNNNNIITTTNNNNNCKVGDSHMFQPIPLGKIASGRGEQFKSVSSSDQVIPSPTSSSNSSELSSQVQPNEDYTSAEVNNSAPSSPQSSCNSSYGSNSGRRLINNSSRSITSLVPGGVVTTQNISTVIRPKGNNNSFQFVKIQPPELSKKAAEQIRIAEESKVSKEKIKEVEEEWQNNLLNWKSKRRQQLPHLAEHKSNDDSLDGSVLSAASPGTRKVKTFAEMLEQRAKSGNRLGFNLQRYMSADEGDENTEAPSTISQLEQLAEPPSRVVMEEPSISNKLANLTLDGERPSSLIDKVQKPQDQIVRTVKGPEVPPKPILQSPIHFLSHTRAPTIQSINNVPPPQVNSRLQAEDHCSKPPAPPLPLSHSIPQTISPIHSQQPAKASIQSINKIPALDCQLKAKDHCPQPAPQPSPPPPLTHSEPLPISPVHLRPQSRAPIYGISKAPALDSQLKAQEPCSQTVPAPLPAPSLVRLNDFSITQKQAPQPPPASTIDQMSSPVPINDSRNVSASNQDSSRGKRPRNSIHPPSLQDNSRRDSSMSKRSVRDDKDKTVLSVSGKKRCSSCREELGRGAAAFVVESLSLVYHTNCFRCSVCHVNLSNGFRGVDVRVHAGALHCQNCYSKDGLNYSRV